MAQIILLSKNLARLPKEIHVNYKHLCSYSSQFCGKVSMDVNGNVFLKQNNNDFMDYIYVKKKIKRHVIMSFDKDFLNFVKAFLS